MTRIPGQPLAEADERKHDAILGHFARRARRRLRTRRVFLALLGWVR